VAYTINKTNGDLYATVADGTIDSTSSLKLVGKNYTGYGEIQNENYFRLMESHANIVEPPNPQKGQLWYDTVNSVLNVYSDGSTPKPIAIQSTSLTEPAAIDSQVGDTWYNTTTNQLTVYDGATYTTVGPLYSSTEGETGAIVATVTDDVAGEHVITQLMNNDEIVAIVSKDASFIPDPVIGGFATIEPGITLSTTVAGAQFTGDASNALLLNGQSSADFLSSVTDNSTTGKLDIVNDTGLTIGLASDLRISVINDIHAEIVNDTAIGDIYIRTAAGGLGSGITIDGASGNARVELPLNGLDIANQSYVTSLTAGKLNTDGTLNMTGSLVMDSNTQIKAGSSATFAAPSYSFDNDTNTGWMSAGSGAMYIIGGGVARITINSSGKLSTGNTPNYETLLTLDDDIPNKKYVDDAIAGASSVVAMDYPDLVGLTMRTTNNLAWQTVSINANARYAFVSAYVYGIFDQGGGQVIAFARKPGTTGIPGPRWEVARIGHSLGLGGGGGAAEITAGSVLVECNGAGQIEAYAYTTAAGTVAESSHMVIKGWIE